MQRIKQATVHDSSPGRIAIQAIQILNLESRQEGDRAKLVPSPGCEMSSVSKEGRRVIDVRSGREQDSRLTQYLPAAPKQFEGIGWPNMLDDIEHTNEIVATRHVLPTVEIVLCAPIDIETPISRVWPATSDLRRETSSSCPDLEQ